MAITKRTAQRILQHMVHKTTKNKYAICSGHHYAQINTNNVNKTCTRLQTTGGKHEPNIAPMRKPQRTSQHGTQNAKTHHRTTQKTKKMNNTDPSKKTWSELRCSRSNFISEEPCCYQ